MAASLESRLPLLDYRLVDAVFQIPSRIKLKNGELKYIFKKVVGTLLPKEIVNRRDKKGFPTPINRWLKRELRNWSREIILDKKTLERGIFERKALEKIVDSISDYSRNIWGIINLELWFRTFIDKNTWI